MYLSASFSNLYCSISSGVANLTTYQHANRLSYRFRILELERYCYHDDDILYSLEMVLLKREFRKILKSYDDTDILNFSSVEKILENANVEEKYKQHIKRKIRLLTIKNKITK